MSRPPIFIGDLKQGIKIWKMSIRIVDLWIVRERNGQQHLEFVIQDAKGEQIQVVTRSREFKEWVDKLREYDTYMLYNGEPMINSLQFKVCDNKLMLMFGGGTTVSNIEIPDFPPHQYKFKSISDFLNGSFKSDYLYDFIGVLHEVVKTQTHGGNKKACANITMSDESGSIIEVALWEDYGNKFMSFANSNTSLAGPTIIILTHAMCKQNNSTGKLQISNAWNGSRLFINLDHPQVHSFKARLSSNQCFQSTSKALSQTSDSIQTSQDKSFTNLREVMTIADINDAQKECYAITVGTTMRFKCSKFGWYYEVCPTCKKSNKSPGEPFECGCVLTGLSPLTKYKVEIEVEYNKHVANVVFWDKDCIKFIKLTAQELRTIMNNTGEDHHFVYPTHLDKLLELELAFRVKYNPFYKQCSVVKLSDDDDVISTIKDYINSNENTSSAAKSNNIDTKPADILLQEHRSPSVEPNYSAPTTASVHPNWSPTSSSSNTPSKRNATEPTLDDSSAEVILTPKESATKVKHFKKE